MFELDFPQTGAVHLSAFPFSVGENDNGANLDIKITLLNALMQPVNVYNPDDLLDVVFDTTLTAGRYYIIVNGTGNKFSSVYGSLGSYTIAGTFTPLAITSIRDIALTGVVYNTEHRLNWNILSDEPVKKLDIETSYDGSHFKSLDNIDYKAKNFKYDPFITADVYYRLKATSVIDETIYSNVIVLKSNGKSPKPFTISTVVHDEILVNASKNYTYLLSDINGRTIANGSNSAGLKRININNHPYGIYVMQIISENERITERIIRQ